MRRPVTHAELLALAIEAEAVTEKIIAVAGDIRKRYAMADDVMAPATHAVVFARLGSEAADLSGIILTLMASRERTAELQERLAAAPPQGEI